MNSKLDILKKIPGDGLLELANKHGIEISNKNNNEIMRKEIAENLKIKDINSIYKEFKDAGNVTIHLFEFPKFSLLDPNIENEKQEIIDLIKKIKPNNNSNEIKIMKIQIIPREDKLKIWINTKGKEISEIDSETNKLIEFIPLIQIVAVIHLKDGLVEIRTREREIAKLTIAEFSNLFGIPYNNISFDEDNLEKMVNWASTFRNATMKPLSGGISSIRMTANQNSDLNTENLYIERDSIIGESFRTGIYLQFDINRAEDDIRKIGFQINAKHGKIFFQTITRESEIDTVLTQIKRVKNVSKKTKSEKSD